MMISLPVAIKKPRSASRTKGARLRGNSLAKIQGKRSGHAMLASNPVSILNHKPPETGIPSDSIKQ
jgi:hypothetical protein